jgi:hypothetical protein
LFLFLIATSLPLFAELWLQRSFKTALIRILKQLFTFSPLLYIFQAKTIGHYMTNELRFGGATYVSTGRGLPTERRPFLRREGSKFSGLYLDYATIAYHDGAALLGLASLVLFVGGIENAGAWGWELRWLIVALGLTISSWLYAPFLFNPYMFSPGYVLEDVRTWFAFFFKDNGRNWATWYTEKMLKPKAGRRSGVDIALFLKSFLFLAWYEVVSLKVQAVVTVYSQSRNYWTLNVLSLLPPAGASMILCCLAVAIQQLHRKCKRTSMPEQDLEEARGPCEENGQTSCIPLSVISILALVLETAEAVAALQHFWDMGWTNALVAGLVLKLLVVLTLTCWGEECLRALHDTRCGFMLPVLQLWVQSHRMLRDLLTSSIILVALMPLVLLNALNDGFCPGCSVHQLLIFRDHKPPTRQSILIARKDKPKRSIGLSFWRTEITRKTSRGSAKSGAPKSRQPSSIDSEPMPIAGEYTTETTRTHSRVQDETEVEAARLQTIILDNLGLQQDDFSPVVSNAGSTPLSISSEFTTVADTSSDGIKNSLDFSDGTALSILPSSNSTRSTPDFSRRKGKSKVTFHFTDGLPVETEIPLPATYSQGPLKGSTGGVRQTAHVVPFEDLQRESCWQSHYADDQPLQLPEPCETPPGSEVGPVTPHLSSTRNALMTPRYGYEAAGFSCEEVWTCKGCSNENDATDLSCGVCGDPKDTVVCIDQSPDDQPWEPPESHAEQETTPSDTPSDSKPTGFSFVPNDVWTCQSCSTENGATDLSCGVCGELKDYQPWQPPPLQPKEVLFGDKAPKSPTLMQSAQMCAHTRLAVVL